MIREFWVFCDEDINNNKRYYEISSDSFEVRLDYYY